MASRDNNSNTRSMRGALIPRKMVGSRKRTGELERAAALIRMNTVIIQGCYYKLEYGRRLLRHILEHGLT